MNWLDSTRETLDRASSPISFFFRDDDVGWDDERLFKLLQLFLDHQVPLDLAVIPKALSPTTGKRLRKLMEMNPGRLSVHQHGYAHINHESNGRKSEFGETRSIAFQAADIRVGKYLLKDLFGVIAESIFTPPWNRCTEATAERLQRFGFTVLSRDITAPRFDIEGLAELPVSVDWCARRQNLRLTPQETGNAIRAAASTKEPVGVMLHHAVMSEQDLHMVSELLRLLSSHSQVRCLLMRDLIRPMQSGATS